MADFMHCNCCYLIPSPQTTPKYFLTNCFHLLCQPCLQKATGNPVLCPVCNCEMRSIEINSSLDPKLQELFKPPKKLIQEKMATLKRKYDFQQMLANSILGHLKKQREKLSQLMKYCQKQTQFSKEQAKEMEELKEWVRTAEIKMKESEKEKISLMKEIEDMKKLSRRFGRDSIYDSTIDKIFADAENSRNNETECTSNLSFNGVFGVGSKPDVPSFLQTNSEADAINSSLGSLGCNLVVSPQTSVTSSVVSELTTPKLLGIPKKGHCNSGGDSIPSRRTPSRIDAQNPYAEVFSRSSSLSKHTSRIPGIKLGHPIPSRSTAPRLHSKSPTTSGYVTHGTIIPRVNTPSGMGRDKF